MAMGILGPHTVQLYLLFMIGISSTMVLLVQFASHSAMEITNLAVSLADITQFQLIIKIKKKKSTPNINLGRSITIIMKNVCPLKEKKISQDMTQLYHMVYTKIYGFA